MVDERERSSQGEVKRGAASGRASRHFSRFAGVSQTRWHGLALLPLLLAAGCSVQPLVAEPAAKPPVAAEPSASDRPIEAPAAEPVAEPAAPKPPQAAEPHAGSDSGAFRAARFAEMPGWTSDDHAAALAAFVRGCEALAAREPWRAACAAARKTRPASPSAARMFFESHFRPYRALNEAGGDEGLVTGYYEPLLHGSRKPSVRYRFPLYGVPEDLLVVDLSEVHPELKGRRVRGRLEGRRVVPYYSRAQIESKQPPLDAKVLYWVDDPIDLFFLQIQGSGQIRLDSGERVRIGYGDQNGYPYRSIGRFLIDRGELTPDQASMQAIKAWARHNPDKLPDVLQHNASYVFFRELPADLPGPLGALGVPVSAGRSLAVDPRHVPLGAPVYLATTWPNTKRPLQRLMMAQDTGSAIRGPIRGDYFWGYGDQAGVQAGRMRQSARMWVLLPLGASPERLLAN
jgi:membrane-bound lytic murein transglycosylase A